MAGRGALIAWAVTDVGVLSEAPLPQPLEATANAKLMQSAPALNALVMMCLPRVAGNLKSRRPRRSGIDELVISVSDSEALRFLPARAVATPCTPDPRDTDDLQRTGHQTAALRSIRARGWDESSGGANPPEENQRHGVLEVRQLL